MYSLLTSVFCILMFDCFNRGTLFNPIKAVSELFILYDTAGSDDVRQGAMAS